MQTRSFTVIASASHVAKELVGAKLLVGATVLIGATLLLGGCGSSAEAIDASGISTIEAGTFTVCSDIPYAPFEIENDGKYSGIDVDVLNAVGSDLKHKVVFKATAFDNIFDAMNNKKCDLVASAVSISDERKKTMLFSDGYFEINQSLLVRSVDSAMYSSLTSLKGHKIGVQKGTTGEEYANAHAGGATVVGYDGVDDMQSALASKAVDGLVLDFPVNSYMAQKDSSMKVVQTFTDVQREEYGIAMPESAGKLQTAVNASLKRIRSDGRYDAILVKYLGSATAK